MRKSQMLQLHLPFSTMKHTQIPQICNRTHVIQIQVKTANKNIQYLAKSSQSNYRIIVFTDNSYYSITIFSTMTSRLTNRRPTIDNRSTATGVRLWNQNAANVGTDVLVWTRRRLDQKMGNWKVEVCRVGLAVTVVLDVLLNGDEITSTTSWAHGEMLNDSCELSTYRGLPCLLRRARVTINEPTASFADTPRV